MRNRDVGSAKCCAGVQAPPEALPAAFRLVATNLMRGTRIWRKPGVTEFATLLWDGCVFRAKANHHSKANQTTVPMHRAKSGLSVGAGLMAAGAQLDYAVSPETGLGSIQRLTLKKKF